MINNVNNINLVLSSNEETQSSSDESLDEKLEQSMPPSLISSVMYSQWFFKVMTENALDKKNEW